MDMHDNSTDELAMAIAMAAKAHLHQRDKAGAPYVLHPLRIMFRLAGADARVVAVLHDVVEDSDITLDDLRARGFSEKIVAAVDCLTHRPHESYDDYIERIAPNPLAVQIKLEDLRDNLDLTRMKNLSEEGFERIRRYHKALARLQPLATGAAD